MPAWPPGFRLKEDAPAVGMSGATIRFSDNWEGRITMTGVGVDKGISSRAGGASLKVVADAPTVVRLFETGPSVADMFMGPDRSTWRTPDREAVRTISAGEFP